MQTTSTTNADGVAGSDAPKLRANERLEALQVCLERRGELLTQQLNAIDGVSDNVKKLINALSEQASSAPSFRVGFYGPRGAGKTSLLNHILKHNLLPTAAAETATASITEVIAHRDPNNSMWTALIDFITNDEWAQLVDQAQKDVALSRKDSSNWDGSPAVQALITALTALAKSEAAVEDKGQFPWENKQPNELLTKEQCDLLATNYTLLTYQTAGEMSDALLTYTSPVAEAAEQLLWPLVRKVTVWGPLPLLRNNSFSVLDIPGSESNGNIAMTTRCLQGKAQCDRLYYLPDQARVFNQATMEQLRMPEHIAFPLGSFGLILPRWKSTLLDTYKKWGKLSTEEAIQQVRKKLESYKTSEKDVEVLWNTPVFPVESAGAMSDDALLQSFVHTAITTPSQAADTHAVKQLLDGANGTFSLLHHLVSHESNLPQALAAAVLAGKQQPAPALDQATFDQWKTAHIATLPANSSAPLHNVLWNSMQVVLRQGGRHGTVDVPLWLVASSIDPVGIDAVRQLVFSAVRESRTATKQLVMRTLQQQQAANQADTQAILNVIQEMDVEVDFLGETVRFANNASKAIAAKLAAVHQATWAAFEESGSGCLGRMRNSLNQWIQQNVAAIAADVALFTAEHAAHECQRLHTNFLARLDFGDEFAAVMPAMRKSQRLRSLLALCTPITPEQVEQADYKVNLDKLATWNQADHDEDAVKDLSAQFRALTAKASAQAAPLDQKWKELHKLCDEKAAILFKVPHGVLGARTRLRGKVGHVYVMTNEYYEASTVYKIGETQFSAEERAKQLSTTGVAKPLQVKQSWATPDTIKFEKGLMHRLFDPVRVNHSREFFQAPLPLIIQVGDIVKDIIQLWSGQ